MGKNKICDASTRKIIVTLNVNRKWTHRKIVDHLGCSLKMVFNTITCYKQHRTAEHVPRKVRPRKTTSHEEKLIIRLAKKDPFNSSNLIRKDVFSEHDSRNVFARLVRTCGWWKPSCTEGLLRKCHFSQDSTGKIV